MDVTQWIENQSMIRTSRTSADGLVAGKLDTAPGATIRFGHGDSAPGLRGAYPSSALRIQCGHAGGGDRPRRLGEESGLNTNEDRPAGGLFSTTQWSLVLAAGDSQNPNAEQALTALLETYWYPVYARIRQSQHGIDDARDLTQGFFLHLLEKKALGAARPERGRFRSFLRTMLRNYVINESVRERARKRGGAQRVLQLDFAEGEERYGSESEYGQDPEKLFERRWAREVLGSALKRLRAEVEASPQRHRWHRLEEVLTDATGGQRYRDLAEELGMSESAVKVSVHRLRKRYGALLREEVARTVGDRADIDDEVRYLLSVVRS